MKMFELSFFFLCFVSLVYGNPKPRPNPDPEPQLFSLGALRALGFFGTGSFGYRAPVQYRPYQYPQSLKLDNFRQGLYSTQSQSRPIENLETVRITAPPRILTTTTKKTATTTITTTTPTPTLPPVINDKNYCGQHGIVSTPLIYSGNDAEFYGAWPWSVAFYFKVGTKSLRFICGGSLISKKITISAAHCFFDKQKTAKTEASAVQMLMGRHNLQDFTEDNAKYFKAKQIVIHPEYDAYNLTNGHDADIALIESLITVEYTSHIRPVCLWINDNIVTGVPATIIGWGLTDNEELSSVLKQANVIIYDRETCSKQPGFQSILTERKICAAGENASPCKGDSGGGLYIYTKDRWYLRGIISETLASLGSNKRCGLTKFATYTDIPKFYNWIIKYL